MLRLRPYKSCDAETIAAWIKNETVFCNWGGERFGSYSITPASTDNKYIGDNGDCVEPDNFYPWVAVNEDERVVDHLIMRYTGGDHRQLRFGWVIVDDTLRGKGYGQQMLRLGLRYAFELLQAEVVTIGVLEGNEAARQCYRKVGFLETGLVQEGDWMVVEMRITNSIVQEA